MMSNTTRRQKRLFGLIDAAANPAVIYALLEKSGTDFRSVFAGLQEEGELTGPIGTGIGGGGRNVLPVRDDGSPSWGSGTCCTSIPLDWQPDLRLTVRRLVDKKQDGNTPGYWYKAENVQIARYDGQQSGGIWAIFLPGDRVRLMIADGNSSGWNDLNHRPPDNDPYIVQGVRDDEWNQRYRKGGNTQ